MYFREKAYFLVPGRGAQPLAPDATRLRWTKFPRLGHSCLAHGRAESDLSTKKRKKIAACMEVIFTLVDVAGPGAARMLLVKVWN